MTTPQPFAEIYDSIDAPTVRLKTTRLPETPEAFRDWLDTQEAGRHVMDPYRGRCELEHFLLSLGNGEVAVGIDDYTLNWSRESTLLPPWALAVRQHVDHIGGTVAELAAFLDGGQS